MEVDPLTMGIDQHLVIQEVEETYRDQATEKQEVLDYIHDIMRPDPKRSKGLHGSAILSRYPLSNVRLVPFRFQAMIGMPMKKRGGGHWRRVKPRRAWRRLKSNLFAR